MPSSSLLMNNDRVLNDAVLDIFHNSRITWNSRNR